MKSETPHVPPAAAASKTSVPPVKGGSFAEMHAQYDPEVGLLWIESGLQGYHSSLPTRTRVHGTRDSLSYAAGCLCSGDPELELRGRRVVDVVLSHQFTSPTSPWFGIWPHCMEDPVETMGPADWNWADFLGARLIEILREDKGILGEERRQACLDALRRAAWSIFRRNVGSDYTNVAMKGASVTLLAGEMLGDSLLVEYGRERVANLRKHLEYNGGFAEFNSPTYTFVLINAVELILSYASDPEARKHADAIRVRAWELAAVHFHPPTAQWAGAQSRNYSNWLSKGIRSSLEQRLGFCLGEGPVNKLDDEQFLQHTFPCPGHCREQFRSITAHEAELVTQWTRDGEGTPDLLSTIWMDDHATLGSANQWTGWEQSRAVAGYWAGNDGIYRFRLRVLFDGRDFDGAWIESAQEGPSVQSRISIRGGRGTHHPHFDRPPDGIYTVRDLRVRLEIEGPAPNVQRGEGEAWTLTGGNSGVLLSKFQGTFQGQKAETETGTSENYRWVDLVLHAGEPAAFHPGRDACQAEISLRIFQG